MSNQLPIVPDFDSVGKKKPYQYRCFDCIHGRRCIHRHLTTADSTTCVFSPSAFQPNKFMPLEFQEKHRGPHKKRRPGQDQFEQPIEIPGNRSMKSG